MDDAPPLGPEARLAAMAAERAGRPIIPAVGALETLHVGENDLPWLEFGDGGALQLLHVDLNQGLWISKTRLPPGYRVERMNEHLALFAAEVMPHFQHG